MPCHVCCIDPHVKTDEYIPKILCVNKTFDFYYSSQKKIQNLIRQLNEFIENEIREFRLLYWYMWGHIQLNYVFTTNW